MHYSHQKQVGQRASISMMWNLVGVQTECNRVKEGKARMVPRPKEIHVIRDSWTKLNVTPAKTMQVWIT